MAPMNKDFFRRCSPAATEFPDGAAHGMQS
jgi:hypothetical protein